jgi:hypothetical protein
MNPDALNLLSPAPKVSGIWATLTPVNPAIAPVPFMYNPESKELARAANYAPATVGGQPLPDQNYTGGGGRTLKLSDLILDTHSHGRSLRSLLAAFEALLLPIGPGLSPPPVYFAWGSDVFGPAVVGDLSWTETGWLGGEPATATLSLSLTQIPQDSPTAAPLPAPTGQVDLSERQRAEGASKGLESLTANSNALPAAIRSAFVSGKYDLTTAADGSVTLSDLTGELLGKLGEWDGFDFLSKIEELL